MLGALAGGLLDERLRLGFTTWRAVCADTDLRLATLAGFTLQLLPLAVIGLLLGGVAMLAWALVRRDADHARRRPRRSSLQVPTACSAAKRPTATPSAGDVRS